MSETNRQNCSEEVPPGKKEWSVQEEIQSNGMWMRGGLDWMYSGALYLYAMLIASRPGRTKEQ